MKNVIQIITLLILAGSIISISAGEIVSIGPVTLPSGGTGTADITLDSAPQGLSGYRMTITSDNQAVVTISGVTYPSWAALSETVPGDGGSYAVSAIDLNSGVEPGATSVSLATLNLKAGGAGTAQITMTGLEIDDDSGNAVQAESKPGSVTISGGSSATTPTATPTPIPTLTTNPTSVPTNIPTSVPTTAPTSTPQENKVNLASGWNLINIPMQLSEGSNTAVIFKDIQSDGHSILTFDGTRGWITIGKDDLLTPMTGYWIYTTSPISIPLSISSNPVSPKTLGAGWNLAGISGTSLKSADSALSGLSSWTYVIPFDSNAQQYQDAIINGNINALTTLEPYKAFWIYLNSSGTLTPGL